MIGMTLSELVLSARKLQKWYDQELLDAIQARMKSHPDEVNKKGLMNLAPVHLAVICEQPKILEILVLDGKADLNSLDENNRTPEILASSENLKELIAQLKQEFKRRAQSKGQHLHDLLRKRDYYTSAKDYEDAIRMRVLEHPEEVNEKTFLGRNAIHWCAYYDQPHMMGIIQELFLKAEMNEKDDFGHYPSELFPKKAAAFEMSDFARRRTKRSPSFIMAERRDKIEIKEINASPKVGNSQKLKDVNLVETTPLTKEKSAAILDITTRMRSLSLSLDPDHEQEQAKALALNPRRFYLTPFLKALHASRLAFLQGYLQDHFPLEEIAEIKGSSALYYAFNTRNLGVFSMLLNGGEDITQKDNHDENVTHLAFTQDDNFIDTMLVKAQNSLLEHIDWQSIKKNDLEVLELSRKFNEIVGAQGLAHELPVHMIARISPALLKRISDTHHLDFELVKALYQVCSCLNEKTYSAESSDVQVNTEARHFDIIEASEVISGLIAAHNPQVILAALSKLQPHFQFAQRLISLFLLKETLLRPDTFSKADLNILATVQLSSLLGDDMEDTELKPLLNEMIQVCMMTPHQQVQSYYVLESLIQRRTQRKDQLDVNDLFRLLPNHKTSKRAQLLANELRAYALMLYQNLNLKELASDKWRDPRRAQLTPSVYAFEEYINHLNYVLSKEILSRKNIKDRARFIKYLIKTAQELVAGNVPDYTSAMAIFSCLNSGPITRLEETFAKLDSKSKSALEALKKQLDHRSNYKAMREVLEDNAYALPFCGLMTSDLTFSGENKSGLNRYLITGKVLKRIEKRKQHLFLFHLPMTTNIGRVLHGITLNGDKTEEQLYHESYLLEQKPFKLVENVDITLLKEYIDIIKVGRLPLRFSCNGVVFEGEQAACQLDTFLKKQYLAKKLKLDELEDLMQTAQYCVSPSSIYVLNRSHFNFLPSRAVAAHNSLPASQYHEDDAVFEQLAAKVEATREPLSPRK